MNEAVHTEEYKGLTIEVIRDEYPENPFDAEPPLAVYSDGRITEYATKYGNVNSVPTLTREQIKTNLKDILAFVPWYEESTPKTLRSLVKQFMGSNAPYIGMVEDAVNEAIRESVDVEYESERLKLLVDVYNWAGIPALYKQITGYCQGDWAYVLAVATPKFQEACGNAAGYWDDPQKLAPSIKLFRDWMFGNVYGYEVLDEEGEEIEEIESVRGGYFGDYDEKNGPIHDAKSAIDRYLVRKAYQDRLNAEQEAREARVRQWKSYGGVALMLASFAAMAIAGMLIMLAINDSGLDVNQKGLYAVGGYLLSWMSGAGVVMGGAIHSDYRQK